MNEFYRLAQKFFILTISIIFLKGILNLLFMANNIRIIPPSLFNSPEEYREKLYLIIDYVSVALTYLASMVIAFILFLEIKGERKQLFGLVIITILKPFVGILLLLIYKFYKLEILKQNEK